jgi:hypothetical protein
VIKIAKTELTMQLEKQIHRVTSKQGVFGCFEVTIGWYGKERVDYMTYDTKGVWRCYEIKVSKSDFHSSAAHTFCGNYNYFVMTNELYEEVKDEIPNHVGVYVNGRNESYLVKRAKKQELSADEQVLKDSMIRSLCRESDKYYNSKDENKIETLRRKINYEHKQYEQYYEMYWNMKRKYEKECEGVF